MNIFPKNDEFKAFCKTEGYPIGYNDGLLEYLRSKAGRFNSSINDVMKSWDGTLTSGENLLQKTEEHDNVYWGKTRVSVNSNVAVAPNGTTTSDELVEDITLGVHHINRSNITTGVAINTYVALSAYVKAGVGDRRFILILGGSGFSNAPYAAFNLQNKEKFLGIQAPAVACHMRELDNGWFRCTLIAQTDVAAGSINAFHRITINDVPSLVNYTGDGVSSLYVWGSQLERISFSSPYKLVA